MSDDEEDIGGPGKRARLVEPSEPISDAASRVFALLGFWGDRTPQQKVFTERSGLPLVTKIIDQSDDPLKAYRQLIVTNRTLSDWARQFPVAAAKYREVLSVKDAIRKATVYNWEYEYQIENNIAFREWVEANPVDAQAFLDSFLTVDTGDGTLTQYYYKGQLHRTGGPAVIHGDGKSVSYYRNGMLTRLDGPAKRLVFGDSVHDTYGLGHHGVVRTSSYFKNGRVRTNYYAYSDMARPISREEAMQMYSLYPAILEEHQTPPPQ